MPIVTTLHTVLREPNPDQHRVMVEIAELSDRLIVMSQHSSQFLQEIFQVPAAKIDVIPHGVPNLAFVDPNFYKDRFGVGGQSVLLTFGLLSPNKGVETVIQALPRILAHNSNVTYIVAGATHPHIRKREGDKYRESLQSLAKDLGVEKNVIFHNRFVSPEEMMEFIGSADIYITPYKNEAQVVSGTLAYALGAGKAVISTPYWHALELLDQGRGVLVPFNDPDAIAEQTIQLLENEAERHAMRKRAYSILAQHGLEKRGPGLHAQLPESPSGAHVEPSPGQPKRSRRKSHPQFAGGEAESSQSHDRRYGNVATRRVRRSQSSRGLHHRR